MGETDFTLAFRLHPQQLRGVVHDRLLRRLARGLPGGSAKFVKFRRLAAEAHVFPDQVCLLQRHAELHAVAVFQNQFVPLVSLLDALEAADAVFVMHHQIPFLHLVDGRAGACGAGFFQQRPPRSAGRPVAAEQLGRGKHRELGNRHGETGQQFTADWNQPEIALQIFSCQFGKSFFLAPVAEDHRDVPAVAFPVVELAEEILPPRFLQHEIPRLEGPQRTAVTGQRVIFRAVKFRRAFEDADVGFLDLRAERNDEIRLPSIISDGRLRRRLGE